MASMKEKNEARKIVNNKLTVGIYGGIRTVFIKKTSHLRNQGPGQVCT